MRIDTHFEPILTDRLRLRRSRPEDAETISAYRADPAVHRYQGWERTDPDGVRAEIEEMAPRAPGAPGGWTQLSVEDRATGELVGDVGLSPAEDEPGVIKIGYTMSPAFQGRGYATEAVGALIAYAFDTLGADVVRAYASALNLPSIRVAEKVGMQLIERVERRSGDRTYLDRALRDRSGVGVAVPDQEHAGRGEQHDDRRDDERPGAVVDRQLGRQPRAERVVHLGELVGRAGRERLRPGPFRHRAEDVGRRAGVTPMEVEEPDDAVGASPIVTVYTKTPSSAARAAARSGGIVLPESRPSLNKTTAAGRSPSPRSAWIASSADERPSPITVPGPRVDGERSQRRRDARSVGRGEDRHRARDRERREPHAEPGGEPVEERRRGDLCRREAVR